MNRYLSCAPNNVGMARENTSTRTQTLAIERDDFRLRLTSVNNTPEPAAQDACPKCGAAREADALECVSCGIIFAKWQARQERVETKPQNKSANPIPLLLTLLVLVTGLGAGAWWLLRVPPLAPNEVRITYASGEQCLWTDWTFKIRREVRNNKARGNVLIVGRPTIQTATDSALRIFSETGDKLTINQIREMKFLTLPDTNNTSNNRVISLIIKTATAETVFRESPLPKFSRSRILVPVASYYFPDQSDDYMTWGNVRMTLAGTPEPDCSIKDEISLTRPGHYKKRTPEHVEFGTL